MTISSRVNEPRRIVPRWRETFSDRDRSEMAALIQRVGTDGSDLSSIELEQHRLDWEENPTIGHAIDLVSSAIVNDDKEIAEDAARFILEHPLRSGLIATDLANSILEAANGKGSDSEFSEYSGPLQNIRELTVAQVRSRLKTLKNKLVDDPRDALSWLDLAFNHSRIGQATQAKRAVSNAVALQPDHRLVLRSASRFFVHIHEPDRAHEILRRSRAVLTDPWQMAAEIACATVANRTSKLLKSGRSILSNTRFHPFQTSELASAIATVEAGEGRTRSARRLFEDSLKQPSENAVAQVQWASRLPLSLEVPGRVWTVPGIYEARAFSSFWSGRWKDAVDACYKWISDEPFSSRPIELATPIIAICLESAEQAVRIAEIGLRANPENISLHNNLIFALATAGDFQKAEIEWRKPISMQSQALDRVVWLANGGMIAFLKGDTEAGDSLYELAVRTAISNRSVPMQANALMYWAAAKKRARLRLRPANPNDESLKLHKLVFESADSPSEESLIARSDELLAMHPREVDLRVAKIWYSGVEPSTLVVPAVDTIEGSQRILQLPRGTRFLF